MKIVNVIPIAKGLFQGNLSYFTSRNVKPGALITVPIRKKNVPAIVYSTEEIKQAKMAVKASEFSLKSIKNVKSENFLRPEFIEACKEIAKYFVSPLGPVIKDFIPQAILDSTDGISSKNTEPEETGRHEIVLMQAPQKERYQYYKSIIREEFAKNKSVFFCFPKITDIDKYADELQKGIEKYSIILHTKIAKKKMKSLWNKAVSEKHPVLIMTTSSFLALPRTDVGTTILEWESSPFYKLQRHPYVDVRKAIEIISSKMNTRLIIGDTLIRNETFHTYERNSTAPASRILSEAEQIVVDMNEEQTKLSGWQKTKNYSIISNQLQENLKEAYEHNENVILFINRRGYNPTTICKDCFRTILCEECDTPLVLHKNPGGSIWVCHKCLKKVKSPEKCPYCKGWRLETFGIGTQKVFEEIKKLFPKFKLFKIDSDSIKNTKQGKKVIEDFTSTPGSILIGTEMMLFYLKEPVERVAVISIDGMFALPDFRINEKIFHLLLQLRSLAKKTFLIQTRLTKKDAHAETKELFTGVTRGNLSGFYKTEVENRKQFQYPPFKLLIKITTEGKDKLQIKKEAEALEKKLEEWDPISYSPFIPKIKSLYSWHILLKINPENWPLHQSKSKQSAEQASNQEKLYQILSSPPFRWRVNVDPESLL